MAAHKKININVVIERKWLAPLPLKFNVPSLCHCGGKGIRYKRADVIDLPWCTAIKTVQGSNPCRWLRCFATVKCDQTRATTCRNVGRGRIYSETFKHWLSSHNPRDKAVQKPKLRRRMWKHSNSVISNVPSLHRIHWRSLSTGWSFYYGRKHTFLMA